jgi:hypothetical protein
MALEIMTHAFEIHLGPVTGVRQKITGFIEFNVDGKVSYEFDDITKPVTPEMMEHFNELMKFAKKLFDQYGGIQKIEIAPIPE